MRPAASMKKRAGQARLLKARHISKLLSIATT
jgi:hypothetical protein